MLNKKRHVGMSVHLTSVKRNKHDIYHTQLTHHINLTLCYVLGWSM